MRWQVVVMLMALCFISHLNRISMSVAGDERIMKQYGIAPVKMGIVYSAFLLGMISQCSTELTMLSRMAPMKAARNPLT